MKPSAVYSTLHQPGRALALALSLLGASGCGNMQHSDLEGTPEVESEVSHLQSASKALSAGGARIIRPQGNTGLCIQPANNATTNGTPVILAPCNSGSLQVWAHPDATFRVGGSKCLDVSGGTNQSGTKLQIWDCATNNDNQKFSIAQKTIKWVNTDKCLDVTDGALQSGTAVQIWSCNGDNTNQQWSLKTTDDVQGSAQASTPTQSVDTSGYLKTSGTRIVDKNGNAVLLRGTNIGGWLVTEGWMNGYSDTSDKDPYRFSLETLERRFGADKAKTLMNIWYDKFITTQDLDNIKNMGINAIRVPFGYRNLQNADGSWIKNAAGNIDFSRLDWIVDQAAQRGLYTILDFHIWDTQQANYSLISENNDGGHASLAKAQQIWTQVAQHFLGNANVAAYDVINEPTGSWGNLLQDGLYKAVRAVDKDRIIIMESMSADPASLGWQQVVYSIHQYNMMGNDFGANQSAFWGDLNGSIKSFNGFNIPTYIGEFMVQESGETLGWLLGQYNSNQLSWTNWTYKTVNMGAWGLCNLPGSAHVDILNDSYETIQNTWQNLPACSPETAMVNAFKKALGR